MHQILTFAPLLGFRRLAVFLLAVPLLAVLLLGSLIAAEVPAAAPAKGLAIGGYDPVAYFTNSAPKKGSEQITSAWQGFTWRFVSAAHRDAFVKEPERYAPQYGGFCALGMAMGHQAPIDPTVWSIVDGKLYLNYNAQVGNDWAKDQATMIRNADANWAKHLSENQHNGGG